MKKINPNLKHLSEEELKTWEEKLSELRRDTINTYKVNQITQGRGWIF